tara:strand:+ start:259 stop:414 length:156 start_codon:yes stop_codon:yes gene_type:complete
MEEVTLENWPDCMMFNCKHKRCLSLNSVFCHPHTVNNLSEEKTLKEVLEES